MFYFNEKFTLPLTPISHVKGSGSIPDIRAFLANTFSHRSNLPTNLTHIPIFLFVFNLDLFSIRNAECMHTEHRAPCTVPFIVILIISFSFERNELIMQKKQFSATQKQTKENSRFSSLCSLPSTATYDVVHSIKIISSKAIPIIISYRFYRLRVSI